MTNATELANVAMESASLKPRKSDIVVSEVFLAWVPYWIGDGGSARPAR
jgi:hypothetical protein